MILFSRNSRSTIANWWWTVDKILLVLILALVFIGIFLTCSASPAVANRIGVGSFHFVKKQAVFIPLALGVMFFISMQNLKFIRRTAILGYILTVILTVATLIWGQEIKGATRWIRIFGFPLQPSEFLKPTFIVVAAWLFDGRKRFQDFPGNLLSVLLFFFTAGLLISQPDFGMTFVISVIWGFQFFLAGLPLWLVGLLVLGGLIGIVGAYCFLPHVQIRIQQFLASDNELSYQVKKSLEAFQSGHFFGRGPGEGVVKMNIPDAHTDFMLDYYRNLCHDSYTFNDDFVTRQQFVYYPVRSGTECLLRTAGHNQYGVGPAFNADQRHDSAVNLLRRFFTAGDGSGNWHAFGHYP